MLLNFYRGVLLLFAVSLTACGPLTFTLGTGPATDELAQTTVIDEAGSGSNRIALISVSGMIMNASPRGLLYQGNNPVSVLHEELEKAAGDSNIKAVVLRLNTPGGTVTASDAMYRELLRFKERSGKPVVVLMMDVAASGGYYLACGADHIVAYPTTVTASIGVILQTITFKPAMDRFGIEATAFISGPNKDAGSPFGKLTPGHREVLQKMVDDFYGRFRQVVREGRPGIPDDKFDMVTDGRVLTGEDAKALGLVDELGDIYDAFARAKERAGVTQADLVRYHRPGQFVPSPYATAPNGQGPQHDANVQVNLAQFNFDGGAPWIGGSAGFYYLWQPTGP